MLSIFSDIHSMTYQGSIDNQRQHIKFLLVKDLSKFKNKIKQYAKYLKLNSNLKVQLKNVLEFFLRKLQ